MLSNSVDNKRIIVIIDHGLTFLLRILLIHNNQFAWLDFFEFALDLHFKDVNKSIDMYVDMFLEADAGLMMSCLFEKEKQKPNRDELHDGKMVPSQRVEIVLIKGKAVTSILHSTSHNNEKALGDTLQCKAIDILKQMSVTRHTHSFACPENNQLCMISRLSTRSAKRILLLLREICS